MKQFFVLFTMLVAVCAHAQYDFQSHTIMANTITSPQVKDITHADIDNDGDLDLLCVDIYGVKWFENVDGQSSTMIEHDILEGNYKFISIADVDGDGDIDVISVSNNSIFLSLNVNGSGDFEDPVLISNLTQGTNQIQAVLPVDLDMDGDVDILYSFEGSSSINWPFGWLENIEGDGPFVNHVILANSKVTSISYLDVDGDGDRDLVTSAYIAGTTDILLYVNDGDNNFTSQFVAENIPQRRKVYTRDLDGDGHEDILTSKSNYGEDLSWYKNMGGTGAFALQPLLYTGASVVSDLTLDDLDNDGDMDIVFASFDNDLVAWMENSDGLGTFSEPVTISTLANGPRTVTIYDFDNDGDLDVVSGSSNDDKIAWYENSDGLASFESEQIITSSIGLPLISLLADLDGDGDLDALCFSLLDDKLSWYENEDGEGNFGPQRIISTDMRSNRAMQVADLDGDGDLDIVTGDEFSSSADKLYWFENIDGQGNFVPHVLVQNTPRIVAICLEDLDNDGDVDILYSRGSSFDVLWLENLDGMGTFGSVQTIETSLGTPIDIFCADINGDDHMDVVVGGSNGHTTWYPNNGSNGFPNQILISSPTTYAPKTALADVDGDGDMDIICADEMNSSVQYNLGWRENTDGLGNFGPKQEISTNLFHIESIVPVDIDNDGDIDIIIGSDGGIQIFENTDGEGLYSYFGAVVDNDCDRNTVDCGDINGDGNTDILSGLNTGPNLFSQDSLLWYENSGLLGNKIKGTARIDLDGDGCATSYLPMNGLLIVADDGANSYSTFTLQNGHYEIFLDTGTFVTSAAIALPNYYNSDPESYTSEFLEIGNIEVADFCLTPNALVNDVNIVLLPIDDAAPGFNAEYQLVFQNNGSTTLSGDITMAYDGTKMSFISSSVSPDNQSASLLTFEYTDLYPFEVRTINIMFNILPPPTTNIDDNLNFLATINPVSGDLTPSDNTMEYNQIVIGAYDPNDITCLEGDEIDIENAGEYLHYLIRFQNTGTASAVRVEIVNILDEKLDWSTLQPIGSSHDNVVEIINGNDVTFVFDAIYLPDSTSDEPNSHGYVSYKIRPRSDVVIGDIIYNTAAIYFDFNPPIITNTATTEIVDELVGVRNPGSLSFLVYPVPAEETLRVQSTTLVKDISIYNMLGQKLLSAANSNEVDVSMLKSGMYLIQVADVSGSVGVKKFVKN